MAKDYAKNVTQKKSASRGKSLRHNKNQSVVPWLWLVMGLVLGLFFAALFYLKTHFTIKSTSTKKTTHFIHIKKHVHYKQQNKLSKTQPEYDFYRILPNMKVWVSDDKTPPIDKSLQSLEPVAFVLQVASFKHYKDADRLKAKLALQGMNTAIKPLESKGHKWYRLWVGPFENKQTAFILKQKLTKQKIYGLILKVRA